MKGGSRALMDSESDLYKRKVVGSNLRSGRDCWWGEGVLEQDTEPPTAPRAL